jgi:hypothetical protein
MALRHRPNSPVGSSARVDSSKGHLGRGGGSGGLGMGACRDGCVTRQGGRRAPTFFSFWGSTPQSATAYGGRGVTV